jgi:hypothetical protein
MEMKMSDKIDFVDMTAPEEQEEKETWDKDKAIEQLAHIIFTDCGKAGIVFGLDTDSVSAALLSAAETMVWFSKMAGKIDDEGEKRIRERATELTFKRQEYFKESGLEDLIKRTRETVDDVKQRAGQCKDCPEENCEEDGD